VKRLALRERSANRTHTDSRKEGTIIKPLLAYKSKVIISGKLVESMQFTEPIFKWGSCGESKSKPTSHSSIDKTIEEVERDYRKEHLAGKKRELERLAYCNFDNNYATLITLTYKNNIQDLDIANRDFSNFIKRLKYVLEKYNYPYKGFKLKYIAKPEFQERGAVHYHLLCNLKAFPFAKKNVRDWKKQGTLKPEWDIEYNLQSIWCGCAEGKGVADLEQIDNGMITVISYLTDYMVKQFQDERFINRKSYFTSRLLEKPIEMYASDAEKYMERLLQDKKVQKKDSWFFTPQAFAEQTIQFDKYILP